MPRIDSYKAKFKKILKSTTSYLQVKKTNLKKHLKSFVSWVKSTPSWVKARPLAIKIWFKENRKKKKYHSFKLEKKIQVEKQNIPTSWQLTKQSFGFLAKHFWVFFSVMLVHLGLYFLLVYGPTDFNLAEVQESIKSFFGGEGEGSTTTTFVLLGSVIGAQTQREGSAIFNFLILLAVSLATIWIIRRIIAGKKFKIRDGFYSGMAPVIPVIAILLVMTIQLLPFTISSYIYTVGRTNGIFISGVEDLAFFMVALMMGLFSFYLMTPSILSLYAVTLPDMYPLNTIRLTKKIVQFRRLLVFRRVVALPIIIAFLFFVLLLFLIRFLPSSSIWFVQLFPIAILPIIHIYLFKLYKSLI
jgi:hypothetical protein